MARNELKTDRKQFIPVTERKTSQLGELGKLPTAFSGNEMKINILELNTMTN
jgi:hypothetical protein